MIDTIKNGISVDVDEVVSTFSDAYNVALERPYERNVCKEIKHVLELFKELGIFGTFFVNGKSVAAYPDLIKRIYDGGHEIGCHGYSHKYINQYKSQQEFEEDLEKCLELIYEQIKVRPIGYRTPGCTIFFGREMVLDALKKYGFVYSSSLTSFGSLKQHGYRRASAYPFKWENGIVEFPLSSASFNLFRIPAFGSYFLRLCPTFLTDMAISKLNRSNKRAFFYFHGFELFRSKYPREIMNIDFPFFYVYNLFSGRWFRKKLNYILKKYSFVPYREVLESFTDLPILKDPFFR
ncbi:MAG: hypothetical protein AMJ78_01165 [Omnitrophica WOR_2 bacterium SM23_29]|nr:MAG: hypothetical protein AMJ78_01165 [Omnitrophica WOR_2 bacterium SM23_29]